MQPGRGDEKQFKIFFTKSEKSFEKLLTPTHTCCILLLGIEKTY
jgi:hypothetical protein